MTSDRRRGLISILAATLVAGAALLSSCGGGSAGSGTASTTTIDPAIPTTIDPFAPVMFADPHLPVTVGLSRRFELLLPADPTRAWRWVLQPVDTAIVVPLSTEFIDDLELHDLTTSTTSSTSSTTAPAVTWIPTTTTTIDPDAPESGPLVQVITFAARSIGTTQIVLRYEQIGQSPRNPRTDTFTVNVQP